MRHSRLVLAGMLLCAGWASSANPAPKVGDPLATYSPTRAINQRGKLKCETC